MLDVLFSFLFFRFSTTTPVLHRCRCRCRQSDASIGLSLMDRFTSAMLDFFQAAMARGEDKTAESVRGFSGGSGSASSTLRGDVSFGVCRFDLRRFGFLSFRFCVDLAKIGVMVVVVVL